MLYVCTLQQQHHVRVCLQIFCPDTYLLCWLDVPAGTQMLTQSGRRWSLGIEQCSSNKVNAAFCRLQEQHGNSLAQHLAVPSHHRVTALRWHMQALPAAGAELYSRHSTQRQQCSCNQAASSAVSVSRFSCSSKTCLPCHGSCGYGGLVSIAVGLLLCSCRPRELMVIRQL